MGTFVNYSGPRQICNEKKEEFSRAVLKLFYYGGMMHVRHVDMYNKELVLLEPIDLESKHNVGFYYNYFEDTSWENAGYKYDTQQIYSNKIGSAEFHDVMTAAYCLYELYDEGMGLVEVNGDVINSAFYIGWINHILGTSFSRQNRKDLWKNTEMYALQRLDYDTQITHRNLMSMISKAEYAGGTELSDLLYIIKGTESLIEDELEVGTYPADVFACKKAIMKILEIKGENEGKDKILDLVRKDYLAREQESDDVIKELANISLWIPARVIVYLLCEQLEMPFWKEWNSCLENIYRDEKRKQYASHELESFRIEGWKKPICSISTSEFLKQDNWTTFYDTPLELAGKPKYYLCDADRLYWWDGSDEVKIDERTEKWLCDIKNQYITILESSAEEYDSQLFVKHFIELLDDVNERYQRAYAFQDMFYEFIENGNKKEYRTAVELLGILYEKNAKSGQIIEKLTNWSLGNKSVKCNAGRMNIKRYLSLLANRKLRMKYLGF